jgi:hypothetical protein
MGSAGGDWYHLLRSAMMIPVLFLLLPVLALGALVTRSPEPIHIPLARRSLAGRDDMNFWAKAADHVRAKYGYDALQRRQTSAAIPLTDAVCFLLKLAIAQTYISISSATWNT